MLFLMTRQNLFVSPVDIKKGQSTFYICTQMFVIKFNDPYVKPSITLMNIFLIVECILIFIILHLIKPPITKIHC